MKLGRTRLQKRILNEAPSSWSTASSRTFVLVASSLQESAKVAQEQSAVEDKGVKLRLSFGEQARTVVQVCKTVGY